MPYPQALLSSRRVASAELPTARHCNGKLILAATEGFGPLLQTSLAGPQLFGKTANLVICRRLALSWRPETWMRKVYVVAEVRRKAAKDSLVGYHSHLPEIGNKRYASQRRLSHDRHSSEPG